MGHIEKTAADKKAIGFDYQDFVFIYKLLSMENGESVSLEILDDIHIETPKELILIQVKHTIQSSNITERDIDLWKTLWNWLKSIHEMPIGKSRRYILFTNKGLSTQELIQLFKEPKNNRLEIRKYLDLILEDLLIKEQQKKPGASENPILSYLSELAKDDSGSLDFILDRLEIHSDTENIIKTIDSKLAYFAVPTDKLANTRNELLGAFDAYKYETITDAKKVTIDFNTFRNEIGFDRILHLACTNETDFNIYYDRYLELDIESLSFTHSTFSAQLRDLGLSDPEIIDHGIEMVTTEAVLDELRLTQREKQRIETQASTHWTRVYNRAHRHAPKDEDEHLGFALSCYEQSIAKKLVSNTQALPDEISRGKFIKLSDIPQIGWRNDWQNKYKK